MAYTLYGAPDNASLIIRIALEEMGLAYASYWVNRAENEQSTPAFLGLNPQGLLPVLLSDDLHEPLFETGAILLWLVQKHGALWPKQAGDMGTALKWLFFLSNTLHADLRALFYTERYVLDASLVPALRQGLRQRVMGHFALLEQEIAHRQGTWLLGSDFTVCDVYLAMCARWARLYPKADPIPHPMFANLPHVMALLRQFELRAAVQKSLALEGLIQQDACCFSLPQVPAARLQAIIGSQETRANEPDTSL